MDHLLPATDFKTLILLVLGKRKRLRVAGDSMLPLLRSGNEILYAPRAYQKSLPQVGDIVVTHHPQQPKLLIVKKVQEVTVVGDCFLIGYNPAASTDSRHWGLISYKQLLGKVTNRFC